MKNLNTFGVHWKIIFLEGELPKKGGLGHFADLRGGGLSKKDGVVVLREVDNPMHTMIEALGNDLGLLVTSSFLYKQFSSKWLT